MLFRVGGIQWLNFDAIEWKYKQSWCFRSSIYLSIYRNTATCSSARCTRECPETEAPLFDISIQKKVQNGSVSLDESLDTVSHECLGESGLYISYILTT